LGLPSSHCRSLGRVALAHSISSSIALAAGIGLRGLTALRPAAFDFAHEPAEAVVPLLLGCHGLGLYLLLAGRGASQ